MKNLIIVSLVSLFSIHAMAATITGARLDKSKQNILIDITYGGGCLEHTFELQVGTCLESWPVQCSSELVDVTEGVDMCEALVSKTISISLQEAGLTDGYYKRASLVIYGDEDWRTGEKSSAALTLP